MIATALFCVIQNKAHNFHEKETIFKNSRLKLFPKLRETSMTLKRWKTRTQLKFPETGIISLEN